MDRVKTLTEEVLERARKIQVIMMDVDGVLTQGKIVYDSRGIEIKHFNAHDGLAFKLARVAGLKTGIISSRESGTIRTRATELQIDYLFLGKYKKIAVLKDFIQHNSMKSESICFIGDDLPDVPVMREVGFAVAVQNATEMTKNYAHYITNKAGGEGAVREVVELVLSSKNLLESSVQKIWE
jgi:3-deoxy-D-manno-octulosonate 8-phosphate phosphatase (KDO 8-P phosphatase)